MKGSLTEIKGIQKDLSQLTKKLKKYSDTLDKKPKRGYPHNEVTL